MKTASRWTLPRPRLVFSFMANEDERFWKKAAVVATLVYVLFPIDAVPDLIPVWGWLDDAGATALAMLFLSRVLAPYAGARGGAFAQTSVFQAPTRQARERR